MSGAGHDPVSAFAREVAENIERQGKDGALQALSRTWLRDSLPSKYSYNFTWLGRPIIQYPQDILALQEIVWRTQPELIVETGVAHGGSLVFFASMLELLGGSGRVLGIDIDIRAHNRKAIEAHAMAKRIDMIEGSSIDAAVAGEAAKRAADKRTMVVLDSNHTHAHVAAELEAYAPLVSQGCYLVVLDTAVEDMPASASAGRPWGPGNNPKTAVREFVRKSDRFVVDRAIDHKLLISVGPEGYLLCVK
jgi:cephalosporin hydroxylase